MDSEARYAIGVDIGGTNVKLVLIDARGQILLQDTFLTPKDLSPEPLVEKIIQPVRSFLERSQSIVGKVEGIGFTVPHQNEGPEKIQRQANNMPGLEGFALRPPLSQAFGDSIDIINDVTAAGIGEYTFGIGRGCDRMLLMAIGTGISISVITREEGLVIYNYDSAGDTGHIIVDPLGSHACSCGGRGCLEAEVASPAIRRRALEEARRGYPTLLSEILKEKGDLDASDVSLAAQSDDRIAKDILEDAGFYLGVALTSYLHIFRPSLIVLGGGVSLAGELLFEPVRRTLQRFASPWYLSRLERISGAELGKVAGAIGAACLILFPDRFIRRG